MEHSERLALWEWRSFKVLDGSKMKNWLMVLTLTFCLAQSGYAKHLRRVDRAEKSPEGGVPVLWRPPDDIPARNLLYGPGGKAHEPRGKFRFIEEDFGGTNPKFKVEDEQGVRWKVKLGREAQPETSATRFLWAVGYFTVDLHRSKWTTMPEKSRRESQS
jgi:hypothetical protein